jgi:chromatin structure-remodeling complex protein RSC7
MQYPKIMQPSHVRWEQVPSAESATSTKLAEGLSTLNLANGTPDSANGNDKENGNEEDEAMSTADTAPSILPPVPAVFTRRFAITDVHYETPESSTLGRPGPDGDIHDLGSNGITSMVDHLHPEFASAEVLAELPPECKEALVETAAREWAWKSKWRTETTDGSRAQILQSYSWHP